MPRPSVDRPLTIGAVLKGLREEFPDVSISKIRFLESEGLISPDRSPSGYRHYRPEDVERLRYILRAQREHFWPLKVIREALDALDRGLTPPMQESGRPGPPQPTADPDLAEPAGTGGRLRLTAAELAKAAAIDTSLVDTMVGFGMLTPDETGHFDELALRAAHAAGALSTYGIEARHLRMFRTAVDREVGLVEQAVAGRSSKDAAAERAAVARLCLQLHAALLKAGLRGTP